MPTRRPSATASGSASSGDRARPRRPAEPRADREPRPAARARGLPSGNKPATRGAGRRGCRAQRSRVRSRSGRLRARHLINSAVGEIQQQLRGARRPPHSGRSARRARPAAWRAARAARRPSRPRPPIGAPRLRPAAARPAEINLRYGLGLRGAPTLNDPNFVRALVSMPAGGRGRQRRASPTCSRTKLGGHPGAAERTSRTSSAAPPSSRSGGGGHAGVEARQCHLHRDRRAGGARRPRRRACRLGARLLVVALMVLALVLALVFRSRLRLVPLRRARRRRDHVRADGAGRRAADDGVDRRAAGAARPRGRLRDPVPGARGGRGLLAGCAAGGADDRHRGAGDGVGFLVLQLSPVPMGAASARCWSRASRSRCCWR